MHTHARPGPAHSRYGEQEIAAVEEIGVRRRGSDSCGEGERIRLEIGRGAGREEERDVEQWEEAVVVGGWGCRTTVGWMEVEVEAEAGERPGSTDHHRRPRQIASLSHPVKSFYDSNPHVTAFCYLRFFLFFFYPEWFLFSFALARS